MKHDNTLVIRIFFSNHAAATQAEPQATATTSGLIDQLTAVQNQFAEAGHLVYVTRYDVNPSLTAVQVPFDLAVLIGPASAMAIANVTALGRPVLQVLAEKPERPCALPAYGTCTVDEVYAAAHQLRCRFAQALATFGSRLPEIVVPQVPEPLWSPAPPAPGAPGDGNGSGASDGKGEGGK